MRNRFGDRGRRFRSSHPDRTHLGKDRRVAATVSLRVEPSDDDDPLRVVFDREALGTAPANYLPDVQAKGLAPKTDFTLFVLQVPTAPSGMAWYQGDIHTGDDGTGTHQFFGIFSSETHVLAPGSVAAPQTDPGIDAVTNPATAPVHMYHLGMWFSDPADAAAAGCPGTSTPFDGDHVAGIQVLNTRNFPNLEGPLLQLE